MEIIWDDVKAESNLHKHGIGFEEAATALVGYLMRAVGVGPAHHFSS